MSSLPDFIICGFQKCGTSALYWNLKKHPKIYIATSNHDLCKISRGKEINFFASNKLKSSTNHLGIDWYKSNFKKRSNQICGEVSPSYCHYVDAVISNFKKYSLDAKFIFSIRNPIDRTISAFNHFNNELPISKNWGEWDVTKTLIENHEKYFTFKTRYLDTISKYIKAFGRENLHIIVQERLINKDTSNSEFSKLFNFLGVESYVIENELVHKRNYIIDVKEDDRKYLKQYYYNEVQKLYDILGYKVEEWTEFS